MFKDYIEYIKDNPRGYWFKAKWYGWGWTPVKWQGWMATGIYLLIIFLFSNKINENSSNQEVLIKLVFPTLLVTIIFFTIAIIKGEKPKWNWGKPNDKPKNKQP
jgi:hypothetical protein